MTYLHESPLRCHGNLCTANCLIDSRWVVKLSDFGLYAFKKGGRTSTGCENVHNNNLHDNNDLYEEDMMIPVRRGSTDSKKFTVKYESEPNIAHKSKSLIANRIFVELLYKAPELLRTVSNFNTILIPGTPRGDIYSFAIILYEIHTR
jgi:guanylate cyclase, other